MGCALDIEVAKLAVSIVALLGTGAAAIIGIKSFRRNEQWKRAEFLAAEMKEFLTNLKVSNALTLIDWARRSISLLDDAAPGAGKVRVTRQMQVRALRPHTLLARPGTGDVESSSGTEDSSMSRYTPEEAAIRDCYDAFLDGLERFASYVQAGLVTGPALRPYIGYWIDDIHGATDDPADAAWAAALLTYIEFYRFAGVQWLFSHLGRDISCTGAAYLGFLQNMQDQSLAAQLAKAVKIDYRARTIGARQV